MSDAATVADRHEIVVDEVFPHTLDVVWKTLTSPGALAARSIRDSSNRPPPGGNRSSDRGSCRG